MGSGSGSGLTGGQGWMAYGLAWCSCVVLLSQHLSLDLRALHDVSMQVCWFMVT